MKPEQRSQPSGELRAREPYGIHRPPTTPTRNGDLGDDLWLLAITALAAATAYGVLSNDWLIILGNGACLVAATAVLVNRQHREDAGRHGTLPTDRKTAPGQGPGTA